MTSNKTVLHDRRCRTRVCESSLSAFASKLSITLQDDVSPVPVCNRSHHCFDNVVTVGFACKICNHRARDMIHSAEVRRSFSPAVLLPTNPESDDTMSCPISCTSSVRLRQCESSFARDATEAEHQAWNRVWVAERNSLCNSLWFCWSSLRSGISTFLAEFDVCCFHGFGHGDLRKVLQRFNCP